MQVFIGYDQREAVAAYVAAHSITSRAGSPVSITFLRNPQIPLWRERDQKQSTDFAFSRFLVPYLCNFEGHAVFMDCDMLVRCDIRELFNFADTKHAVHVVKHEYVPRPEDKFLGQKQSIYKRKNWSSVMLFNNSAWRRFDPKMVNSMTGLDLHQFVEFHDSEIGELPKEFNHLVGEYPENKDAKIVHFTRGTPCFREFRQCEFAEEWKESLESMLAPI